MVYACTEFGVTIEEFWGMSYYEFSLEAQKAKNSFEKRALLTREVMSLIANINRDTKAKPSPFKGSDFFRLSFDKEEEEENKPMTPEEVEYKFGKFLKT